MLRGFARLQEKHLVAELGKVLAGDHFVGHVPEVGHADSAAAPPRVAGQVFGRAHADLADDGQEALLVVGAGQCVAGPLPIAVAGAEGVEQGRRSAGIARHDELVGRRGRDVRSLAGGRRGQRGATANSAAADYGVPAGT